MASPPGVSVAALLSGRPELFGLALELLAGVDGLERLITSPYIQKTGLALAGFHEYLRPGRVLIFGESEVRYLESLDPAARTQTLRLALTLDFPCVLITGGFTPPPELVVEAERASLPLLKTPIATPTAIAKLTSMLEDSLAERTMIHAVLMDILGLGVLLVGESGIGKSECALDLIVRGHRLVADDTVEIRRRQETILIGTCPELTRHHMEIRGLGVINIKELFGIASTRSSKRVELVVRLERWDPGREYERLGLDDDSYDVLGLRVPLIRMPVGPGRNIAILVEVAARNQLLKARGHHAARELAHRLEETLRQGVLPVPADDEDDDLGYFCVDNLPTTLIPTLAKLSLRAGGDIAKVAIVVDVREGGFLSSFPRVFRRLRKMQRLNPVLIFLEASHAALVRRFSETRRPHPLAQNRSLTEGIRDERARLNVIRAMADEIVDTSDMTVHELRHFFMGLARERTRARLVITLLSFGYKHGVPLDADLVFDVRCLPNPHFVPALRRRTGRDRAVVAFMEKDASSRAFMDRLEDYLRYVVPHYIAEGKSYLTVAIGCTGGRHRSVMIAERLKRAFADIEGARVRVRHRDIGRA